MTDSTSTANPSALSPAFPIALTGRRWILPPKDISKLVTTACRACWLKLRARSQPTPRSQAAQRELAAEEILEDGDRKRQRWACLGAAWANPTTSVSWRDLRTASIVDAVSKKGCLYYILSSLRRSESRLGYKSRLPVRLQTESVRKTPLSLATGTI